MTRILLCLPFFLFFAFLYPREEVEEKQQGTEIPEAVAADKGTELPEKDVIRFIEKAIERYEKEIKGFRVILTKQERVDGKLRPREVVKADFCEKPHSVLMHWQEGAGLARAVLYAKGKYNDKMLVRPRINVPFFPVMFKEVDGPEARSSGRYTIDQFGIKLGTVRVLKTWKPRQEQGNLHVRFEGVVELPQLPGHKCYCIHRTNIDPPEEDGVADVVLYFDIENWLQVGSVLRDNEGKLIGEYFFDILELNPEWQSQEFTRERLEKL